MEYIPYVYLIKNKTTGLKYLGVEYSYRSKIANPQNIWFSYFTSSKLVHKLIETYGKEDFQIRIISRYPNDPKSAILKEASFFKLLKERDDYLNLCYSSGLIDLRVASKAGKVGGAICKSKSVGIFRSEEDRKKWYSLGGQKGGKVQAERGLGFHKYKSDPELHKSWSSKGGKTSGQFQNKEFQSNMGKRGGAKNKGFRWYNDGKSSFKYTVNEQKTQPFEEFIEETKFIKGRAK